LTVATEKNFRLPDCNLCKWKKCKLISSLTKPEYVLAHVVAPRPAPPEPWTQEDENKLLVISSDDIDLKDTALGVAAKQMAATVTQVLHRTLASLTGILATCFSNHLLSSILRRTMSLMMLPAVPSG